MVTKSLETLFYVQHYSSLGGGGSTVITRDIISAILKMFIIIIFLVIVCEALVLAVGLQGLKYQLCGMFTYDE